MTEHQALQGSQVRQDPGPKRALPHGEWPSPITADMVAAGSGSRSWPSGAGAETWWCALDPRTATVRLLRTHAAAPDPRPVLGEGWSVRNRALGYGGRPYVLRPGAAHHLLVFTDHRDQRLYRADVPSLQDDAAAPGAPAEPEPRPLTPPDGPGADTCYVDMTISQDGTEVWCVREVTVAPSGPGDDDPAPRTRRDIVAVPLSGAAADDPGAIRVVARSHHFLSGARVSPDGRRLAWIGWDHPLMPWDATDLMVADLVDGVAVGAVRVLGGDGVSVPQAEWAGPDTLYAMADPDGWWNLHRVSLGPRDAGPADAAAVECVLPMRRECAGALWRVGQSWFAVTTAGVVLRHGLGDQQLALWRPDTGTLTDLAPGWTEFGSDLWADDTHAVLLAGAADRGRTVLRVPLPGSGTPPAPPVDCTPAGRTPYAAWHSVPERRTAHAADGREVHYVYYPPVNPDAEGPDGEAPPLLIHVHGGPTSGTGATPDLEFSLFCSRGFAVASVDYGGSTGYGREYRDRLRHSWGVVDVEDSVTVARELAALGLADPARTAIRGGSAGGWTSLACLSSTDVFACGAVYYPISDPLAWSGGHTHDFESRYVHGLIGELPRDRARYERVSPLANAARISSPLVMLQGADDFICRPDQAEVIVAAVAARGLWHRYLLFEGEGHGFRKASSVARSLLAEAELYSHVMGVTVDVGHEDA
ncbi:prolyl oligopeptidase family serine peptidase [Streptomyces sp. MI02-7b]|uniref:prolyl oligopeptidase family serine peptidase n=1 Tax=Streptomyces sp. MI02-7b TaxID=462941 RepID=UPI0029BE333D|nr:prolyl oligopeptidase family serine peptidase [Streptomyces sp. MI02-7b]MDX3071369.1 prolyl oligopeptidase family serine peptidase [Streptomyces sp. MI02-7b]